MVEESLGNCKVEPVWIVFGCRSVEVAKVVESTKWSKGSSITSRSSEFVVAT